jgi:hypothetical protein
VKVGTPLGEYPFEFRRIERRGATVVVVGTVAGLESTVVLEAADLRAVRFLAPVVLAALVYRRRRRG